MHCPTPLPFLGLLANQAIILNASYLAVNPSVYRKYFFVCDGYDFIPNQLINDGISDCWSAKDEPLLLNNTKHFHLENACLDDTAFPCFSGDTTCFSLGDLCIFELQTLGTGLLKFCRNGRHLANCSWFDCSLHFKCPGFYCIPFAYTCDGKYDCPNGEDESHECTNRSCPNLFKCKNSSRCLHISSVCDGVRDCPLSDDEVLCDLSPCPRKCACVHYALTCVHVNALEWTGSKRFTFVNIKNSTLDISTLKHFSLVTILKLPENNIVTLCVARHVQMSAINVFDISNNQIKVLGPSCLKHLRHVTHFDLSYNLISQVSEKSFQHLPRLQYIDLSFNMISSITGKIIADLKYLKFISILQNKPIFIEGHINHNTLKLVLSNDFHVCCFVRGKATCTAPLIWPFTCGPLLESMVLKVCIWIIIFPVVTLNIISFVISLVKYNKQGNDQNPLTHEEYRIIVRFLAMSDAMIGFQLVIVAAGDVYFGEEYTRYDITWRGSVMCHFASMLAIFANVLSMYTLGLLSLARLLVTISPLNSKITNPKTVKKILLCGSLIDGIGVFCLIIVIVLHEAIQPFPVCVIYGAGDPLNATVTLLYGLLQILAVGFIIIVYSLLGVALLKRAKRQRELQAHKTGAGVGRLSPVLMLRRTILVTLTNSLCWLPSAILLITSTHLQEYPISILFWVVLVISPINSLLNPFMLQF